MTPGFDVNKYWLSRGRTYMEEERTPPEFHRLQERFLLEVLKRGRIPMGRVLELGCGFGRITKLLAEHWPDAEITALDLSPEQLANARHYCGENPRVHFAPYDFYSGAPLPGSDYDTVVAVEVFMHHPPEVVTEVLKQSAAAGRWIVNVDWSEDWAWPTPDHVWVHDYTKLFSAVGLKSVAISVPARIEGKRQKLFIAAEKLSPELLALECDLRDCNEDAIRFGAATTEEWSVKLNQAMTELARIVPGNAKFILVDDEQWGNPGELERGRVIPFLEKNGAFWGPPDSDAMAWHELERLRKKGATYIVFAWPSFWWLKHYLEFHRKLRAQFRCLLENERLVVFALTEQAHAQ